MSTKLPEPEVRRLLAMAQAGDTQARNAIVLDYQWLAGWLAGAFIRTSAGRQVPRDDLTGEAQIRLIESVYSYKLEHCTRFGSHARSAIWWGFQKAAEKWRGFPEQDPEDGQINELLSSRYLSAEQTCHYLETVAIVRRAARASTPRQRRILRDLLSERLNCTQLAAELGVSQSAVGNDWRLIKRRLQSRLAEHIDDHHSGA